MVDDYEPIELHEFSPDEQQYIEDCYLIARDAHKGVKRAWVGDDYIEHPCRVAEYVANSGGDVDQVAAAYLHDVIEDTYHTRETLLAAHVRPETIDLVEALTRRDGETYEEFIIRIVSDTPRAVPIKQADLCDNLATIPRGHRLMPRYVKALSIIYWSS